MHAGFVWVRISDIGKKAKALSLTTQFEHEVWNDTDQIRVVLFVDFLRPLMFPISLLNKGVVKLISWTPFVRSSLKRSQEWDRKVMQ